MIQFLAYVILSQKKDIFFAIYRIINWMSIFSHKNLWAFKTLNAYQKVSCVWMLCWLFECILIKKWVLVGEYRASCRKHNGSYRRKLRKLYSETPAAAQIVEAQVDSGNLTEQEFDFVSVEEVKRSLNDPYLYKVAWADTENGPDAFIN